MGAFAMSHTAIGGDDEAVRCPIASAKQNLWGSNEA